MTANRKPDHAIEPLFVNRWSPRAFDASPLAEGELLRMLEAARWAPSAYNLQPWRFVYALRDEPVWSTFVELLDDFNASWARQASALVVVVSDTVMPGDGERPDQPSRCHAFDAGAAWAQLALQATAQGYHAHAMAGVHFDEVHARLGVPDRYRVEIVVAIGKQALADDLPEALQQREVPSPRKPVSEIAFAGRFPS